MSIFVHAHDIKTVHAGQGGQKMVNSVHVVVECPHMVCNIEEENGEKTARCHESITTAASAALLENAKLRYGFLHRKRRWKQKRCGNVRLKLIRNALQKNKFPFKTLIILNF